MSISTTSGRSARAASTAARPSPASLELEILDNGSASAATVEGAGHGLIGMRERVALYGGSLTAAARNGHGYAVRATLPFNRNGS